MYDKSSPKPALQECFIRFLVGGGGGGGVGRVASCISLGDKYEQINWSR